MDHMTFCSTMTAVLIFAMATATNAQGACKATLRGELVQAPVPGQAIPRKFLFFTLNEVTQISGARYQVHFQSFVVPNAITTLPIPFALDIDSAKDCPSQFELNVTTSDTDPPPMSFNSDYPLLGIKAIHLDKFESIPVWGSTY